MQAVLQIFRPGGSQKKQNNPTTTSSPPLARQAKASMKLLAGLALPFLSSIPGPPSSGPFGIGGGEAFVARAAEDRRQVADIPASGIIFKDSINIEAFRDPKVGLLGLGWDWWVLGFGVDRSADGGVVGRGITDPYSHPHTHTYT